MLSSAPCQPSVLGGLLLLCTLGAFLLVKSARCGNMTISKLDRDNFGTRNPLRPCGVLRYP